MTIEQTRAIKLVSESTDLGFLVAILELSAQKTGVNTVSESARINGISPNGVISSKRYRKIKIGKQTMVIKGLKELDLPF